MPELAYGAHRLVLRLVKPRTLGVRVIVAVPEGGVVLVRHTYRPGWYLPGGGVDKWERLDQAALREVREETGITLAGLDRLMGLYANFTPERCDHVAVFTARGVRPALTPNREIAEARVFPADALPPDATAATHARMAEYLGRKPIGPVW